eukprot:3294147-Prorocentrum_lima.AAC.1
MPSVELPSDAGLGVFHRHRMLGHHADGRVGLLPLVGRRGELCEERDTQDEAHHDETAEDASDDVDQLVVMV